MSAGSTIDVSSAIRVTTSTPETSPVDAEEYWRLLEQAANEVVNNVQAAISSFPVAMAALTGGRDSRVIYGAILAAGKQNDVNFKTLDIGRDLEVAKSILGKFGGRFHQDIEPFNEGFSHIRHSSLETALESQISHTYFSYHPLQKSVKSVNHYGGTPLVLLGGGSGECFRSFYVNPLARLEEISVDHNLDEMEQISIWIEQSARKSKASTDLILPEKTRTFRELSGNGHRSTFANHYLNFRNKYHFNNRLHAGAKMDFMPLQSETLLKLSRRVPKEILDGAYILSDLVQIFSGDLARHEYDKPWPSNRPTHPFGHDDLQNCEEIPSDTLAYRHSKKRVSNRNRAELKLEESTNKLDFIYRESLRMIDSLSDDSLVGLPRQYLIGKVNWMHQKNSTSAFQWYSKIRMLDWFQQR